MSLTNITGMLDQQHKAQLGMFATLFGYQWVAAQLCKTSMKPSNVKQHATHFLAVTGTQTSIQVIR